MTQQFGPCFHAPTYELTLLYAAAMDGNRPDLLERVFTEDGVIEGKGFPKMEGRARILKIPAGLAKGYHCTLHKVMNHLADVDGDRATGLTYCVADHVSHGDDPTKLIWTIRYLDSYVRVNGAWRIKRRQLVLDFTETVPVEHGPG